jgi:hypothetical protein
MITKKGREKLLSAKEIIVADREVLNEENPYSEGPT